MIYKIWKTIYFRQKNSAFFLQISFFTVKVSIKAIGDAKVYLSHAFERWMDVQFPVHHLHDRLLFY